MLKTLNVTDDQKHSGHMGHIVEDFSQACSLASKYGFDAINIDLNKLHDASDVLHVKNELSKHHLVPAAFSTKLMITGEYSDDEFDEGFHAFKAQARDIRLIGGNLVLCYIPPFSDQLSFDQHFKKVCSRLDIVRPILLQEDLRIGFEFIGPTETRRDSKYDFIHTIDGIRCLIAASNLYGYAGIKLDVHHWQNSGAGVLDLKHLDRSLILYVELNDGLAGYDIFNMPEFERELPMETGATNIEGFMGELRKLGYQGPISVEPWNQKINDMPLEKAIKSVKLSLDKCLSIGGG